MKMNKKLSRLCRALCVVALLSGYNSALAFDAATRSSCYNSWKSQFYWSDAWGGNLRLAQGSGAPVGFFCYALCIEAMEDAVAVGLENADTINKVCTGFVNSNGSDWTWNPFNDDLFWASIAFSRAYQITGNTQWRTLAKNSFDTAYNRGLDSDAGMFQTTSRTYPKATVTTDTGCLAAYLIYKNSGDSSYLGKAQGLYYHLCAHAWVPSSGMVYGATDVPPGTGVWGLACSDNGLFATASAWLGYPAYATKACDFITVNWSLALNIQPAANTADGPQNAVALRGMARAGGDIPWAQAACDNAWSKRNTYNLVNCAMNAPTPNTYNLYCADTVGVVAGMLNVPVIKVTWGNYGPVDGVNLGWDAGSKVDSYVNNVAGSLSVVINNNNIANGGDPAPFHVKQLKATCSIGGDLEMFYVAEGSTLNVMAGSGTVVSAIYAPVDGSNAGSNVASRFSGGVRNVRINNTTMGIDPAPGHAKQLIMVYSVGGKQETVIVLENSALNL